MWRFFLTIFFCSVLLNCAPERNQAGLDEFSKDQLNLWNYRLTQVIVKDIFTPPVASRIYAYSNIAAYEAIIYSDSNYLSLSGQLKGLSSPPKPNTNVKYYYPLVSIIAFSTVAHELVFGKGLIKEYEDQYINEVKIFKIDEEILKNSIELGRKVGDHITAWASKDGYLERQSLSRYVLEPGLGKWEPTPPNYMEGIEPNWNTLRTFLLDSASQFAPDPPTTFDTATNSLFYKESMEVYEVIKNKEDEKIEIAKFWDCNPNVSYTKGHLMFYQQKISPGGHWIHIGMGAGRKKSLSTIESANMYALLSITVADAFISCWDEKYRSNLIRPETYINRYIDEQWKPILQTPAFPEYTSGHSVASASAAVALTSFFGENFAFIDSTEVDYGLPPRKFKSFYDASDEAAISRLYGGIHYMPAIKNGVSQGKAIGECILNRLKWKKEI